MALVHLLLLVLGVSAQVYIPFLYVTPVPIEVAAQQSNQFYVPLCKNSAYDGKTAQISINLPLSPWSPSSQQVVYMKVYNTSDSSGTVLATNNGTGTPSAQFSLTYNVAYGDLYIIATNGVAPGIVYTFSISFGSMAVAESDLNLGKVDETWEKPPQPLATYTMRQVITDSTPFQVLTSPSGPPLLINFTYCPATPSYTLVITAVALDDISATALYICTKPTEMPCNALAQYYDVTGIGISTVIMQTTTGQFQAMQAAVYGWGVYQMNNTFTFSVNVS